MSQFINLNQNINNILLEIISNQRLCKFISCKHPINDPDIEDTTSLLFNNVFPFFKIPDIADKTTSYLNVYFSNFQLSRANTGIKAGTITFDVLCHVDWWKIDGHESYRPFEILHEIETMINDQRIVGLKKAVFDGCRPCVPNSDFNGYTINYAITSGNV